MSRPRVKRWFWNLTRSRGAGLLPEWTALIIIPLILVVIGNTAPSLPLSASFALNCANFESVYVYGYHDSRWWLVADGVEYWIFDEPEGLCLVENPF